jgi:hypothetical protein
VGLLGGIARTAVIAGTATSVSNRVSRRQANRWAAKDQQAYDQQPQQPQYEQQPEPEYAPEAPAPDPLDQLKKLGELKAAGVLTQAEFDAQKARILAG